MRATLIVFLGAGLGGALRHGVNVAAARVLGTAFPWGTLIVNVAGSLAMGALAGWLALKAGQAFTRDVQLFLATGILGGFTTFSAFSLDAILLVERGTTLASGAYVIASVVLSIGGFALGLWLVRVATS